MENSHKFFANKGCRYYPCHEMEGELNCLFCYCPLYYLYNCGGDYTYTKKGVKDCFGCLKIHEENSWEFVQRRLMEEVRKTEAAYAAAHPELAEENK